MHKLYVYEIYEHCMVIMQINFQSNGYLLKT